MLLDIGAGDRPFEDGRGWVHNDARALPDIEVVCDILDLHNHVQAESCEEILARHILEHFSFRETGRVLRDWYFLLKPGGKLKIEVPNLGWQVQAYASLLNTGFGGHSEAELVELMFGGQDYEGNYHCTGFTENTLKWHLIDAGFRNARVQDIGMVLVAEGDR